ncbi:MAG: hypothetical protein EWM50_06380 [Gottschalkiaceae bacterium]|nr:MAG: hypothetical protein EWM50_06380 [Gottschalkiaceae bacterium]
MGGPSTYSGTGGGAPVNNCGNIFEFWVLFQDEIRLIFSDFKVGQEVKLKLIKDKLPKLEVVRVSDGLLIGLVPPSLSMLIKCIQNGWQYYGNILKIEGNEIDPKIYVRLKGEE